MKNLSIRKEFVLAEIKKDKNIYIKWVTSPRTTPVYHSEWAWEVKDETLEHICKEVSLDTISSFFKQKALCVDFIEVSYDSYLSSHTPKRFVRLDTYPFEERHYYKNLFQRFLRFSEFYQDLNNGPLYLAVDKQTHEVAKRKYDKLDWKDLPIYEIQFSTKSQTPS